ncbi:hypothetical protein VTG60DRAFT_6941 [Thermothelomyces hinnuleus]
MTLLPQNALDPGHVRSATVLHETKSRGLGRKEQTVRRKGKRTKGKGRKAGGRERGSKHTSFQGYTSARGCTSHRPSGSPTHWCATRRRRGSGRRGIPWSSTRSGTSGGCGDNGRTRRGRAAARPRAGPASPACAVGRGRRGAGGHCRRRARTRGT